jgi:hypothetical protein
MIRLGLRLVVAGGRPAVIATALTALAVAFGTAILLYALSFEPAFQTRFDHAAWRDTSGIVDVDTATSGLILQRTDDHWQGQRITRMDVAALSVDAPLPPGLDYLPAPGATYVSPALARLIAANPPDQLGDRFGVVSGTISTAGLMAPDELVAVVGRDAGSLRATGNRPDGARVVAVLDGVGQIPTPRDPIVQLLVVIAVIGALAPVAVFVAMATRLSAARRERRLAVLRLVGATPWQVTMLAAVESLVATIPGALGGIVLFLALRPLVAQVPLGGAAWFAESITPPPAPALAMLLAVPVIGVAAAVLAIRRLVVTPLGVHRQVRPGPLRRLRLVPLLVCLAAFGVAVVLFANGLRGSWVPAIVGLPFLGIVIGIAYAGPWVTAAIGAVLVRVARGPATLLAGRRLLEEPRASFGAVGGVVLAVFVGSAFLGISSFTRVALPTLDQLAVRPEVLVARYIDAARAEEAATSLRSTAGVSAVALLREVLVVEPGAPDGSKPGLAVVVDCPSLLATLDATALTCEAGLEHLGPDGRPLTSGTAQTFGHLSEPAVLPVGVTSLVPLSIPADRVDRYAPDAPREAPGLLPAVLIEPAAFGNGLGDLLPTRLVVRTDGTPAAIERARTLIEAAMPTSIVATIAEEGADASGAMAELGRVVWLGVLGSMLFAGASLAVAVVTSLLERRVPFALLRLAGTPVARLRAVLLLEAAAPLAAVCVLSAVLGTLVVQLLMRAQSRYAVPLPDAGVIELLVIAVAAAMGIVALTMPMVRRLTDTEETRFE